LPCQQRGRFLWHKTRVASFTAPASSSTVLSAKAERNSAMNLTTRASFSAVRKEPFNTLSLLPRRKGWVNKTPFPGNDWMFQ
jgi:hypothetical protein